MVDLSYCTFAVSRKDKFSNEIACACMYICIHMHVCVCNYIGNGLLYSMQIFPNHKMQQTQKMDFT